MDVCGEDKENAAALAGRRVGTPKAAAEGSKMWAGEPVLGIARSTPPQRVTRVATPKASKGVRPAPVWVSERTVSHVTPTLASPTPPPPPPLLDLDINTVESAAASPLAARTPTLRRRSRGSMVAAAELVECVACSSKDKAIHALESKLINEQEDAKQYASEYLRIQDEGKALFVAYQQKCTRVIDLTSRVSHLEQANAALEHRLQLQLPVVQLNLDVQAAVPPPPPPPPPLQQSVQPSRLPVLATRLPATAAVSAQTAAAASSSARTLAVAQQAYVEAFVDGILSNVLVRGMARDLRITRGRLARTTSSLQRERERLAELDGFVQDETAANAEAALEQAEQQVVSLRGQLEQARDTAADSAAQLADATARSVALSEELGQLKQQLEEAKCKQCDLEAQLDGATTQLLSEHAAVSQHEEAAAAATARADALAARVAELEQQHVAALEQAAREADSRVAKAVEQVQLDAQQAKAATDMQIAQLTEEAQNSEALRAAAAELEERRAEVRMLRTQISAAKAAMEPLQQAAASSKAEVLERNAQLAAVRRQLDTATSALAQADARYADQVAELTRTAQTKTRLADQAAHELRMAQEAASQAEAKAERASERAAALQSQLDGSRTETVFIEQLEKMLARERDAASQAKKAAADAKDNVRQLEDQVRSASLQQRLLENDKNQLMLQLDMLLLTMDQRDGEQGVHRVLQAKAELERIVEAMTIERQALTAEMTRTKEQLDKVQRYLRAYKAAAEDKIRVLQGNLSRAESEVSALEGALADDATSSNSLTSPR